VNPASEVLFISHEAADAVAAEHSEIALADAFTARYGDTWRYVAAWDTWFVWQDSAWVADDLRQVWDRARSIVEEASVALSDANKPGPAKAIASAKTVAAVVKLASTDPIHAAGVEQWDSDPWVLNTPGGIIDLKTGDKSANTPLAYCTKVTGAAPADAVPEDSEWLKFLRRICGGDQELMGFLKRAAGYSLTGSTREEAFFFLHGPGQNGKSKFLEAISDAMGGYHEIASMDTFVASKHTQHPADLAKLRGARMVTASETEEGRRWAESKIKSITGGDEISARFMRMNFFTFKPQLKLWIAGNHKPGLQNVDKAMRRRINLIPFTITIPEAERDRDLSAKLKAEASIILTWMIEGCLEWQRDGLLPPKSVTDATDAYISDEDCLGHWLDECCEVGPNYRESFSSLWLSWQVWAMNAGEDVSSKRKLGQALQQRGFSPSHYRLGRVYAGLALKA
jgi:putative DNA primase/helicase